MRRRGAAIAAAAAALTIGLTGCSGGDAKGEELATSVRDAVAASYGRTAPLTYITGWSGRDAPRVTVITSLADKPGNRDTAHDICMIVASVGITVPDLTGVYVTAGEGGAFLATCDAVTTAPAVSTAPVEDEQATDEAAYLDTIAQLLTAQGMEWEPSAAETIELGHQACSIRDGFTGESASPAQGVGFLLEQNSELDTMGAAVVTVAALRTLCPEYAAEVTTTAAAADAASLDANLLARIDYWSGELDVSLKDMDDAALIAAAHQACVALDAVKPQTPDDVYAWVMDTVTADDQIAPEDQVEMVSRMLAVGVSAFEVYCPAP